MYFLPMAVSKLHPWQPPAAGEAGIDISTAYPNFSKRAEMCLAIATDSKRAYSTMTRIKTLMRS